MYDQGRRDIQIAANAALETLADPIATARLGVGLTPYKVRALWCAITATNTVVATILTFKFRPTPGSASGEQSIGTITLPINGAAGKVYYKDGIDYDTIPGGEIVVSTDGGGTVANGSVGITVEDKYETPGNYPSTLIKSA